MDVMVLRNGNLSALKKTNRFYRVPFRFRRVSSKIFDSKQKTRKLKTPCKIIILYNNCCTFRYLHYIQFFFNGK